MEAMEPACAICSAPHTVNCECEASRLELALNQSSGRVIGRHLGEVREWVQEHAKGHIDAFFQALRARRQSMHDRKMQDMQDDALYHGYVAIDPAVRAAELSKLQHGINEDWKQALQRYPEVLDYFYSFARVDLPPEQDVDFRNGPLEIETRSLRSRNAQIGPPPPASGYASPAFLVPTPPMTGYPPVVSAPQAYGGMPGAFPSHPPLAPPAPSAPSWAPYPGYR